MKNLTLFLLFTLSPSVIASNCHDLKLELVESNELCEELKEYKRVHIDGLKSKIKIQESLSSLSRQEQFVLDDLKKNLESEQAKDSKSNKRIKKFCSIYQKSQKEFQIKCPNFSN